MVCAAQLARGLYLAPKLKERILYCDPIDYFGRRWCHDFWVVMDRKEINFDDAVFFSSPSATLSTILGLELFEGMKVRTQKN
jgi:hypothetical protein